MDARGQSGAYRPPTPLDAEPVRTVRYMVQIPARRASTAPCPIDDISRAETEERYHAMPDNISIVTQLEPNGLRQSPGAVQIVASPLSETNRERPILSNPQSV